MKISDFKSKYLKYISHYIGFYQHKLQSSKPEKSISLQFNAYLSQYALKSSHEISPNNSAITQTTN